MRAEVVAIGTELLLGQIIDTNSAWLGEQLALAGVDCHHQSTVGDNLDRIVDVLELALTRADVVLVSGGLGPTQDDITRDAIARVMGVELELDDEVAARIEAMFTARGRRMPMSNMRQAEVPRGARAIHEPQPGTAPGLICPVGDKVIYAMPGVPHELKEIVTKAVLPDLRARTDDPSVILSRTLRTWGESESGLAERVAGRIEALDRTGNPTIAFLASGIEGIKIRVTAKAPDEASAHALLAAEEAELRTILGPLVFGVDSESMEDAVAVLLDAKGLTLAVAESLTGGLVAARLVNVAGASGFFKGGIVAYDSDVKFDLLDVPEGPVVSEKAARAMAEGVRRRLDADVGLSVTGVAGPAEQDGQPPGTVFFGMAVGDDVVVQHVQLPGDRDRVRQFACISLLNMLRLRLLGRRTSSPTDLPIAVGRVLRLETSENSPMVPDEVATFGREVAATLQGFLGDDLVGTYYVGSVALGGYVAGESDIDIVAVSERMIRDDEKLSLAGSIVDATASCPARGLEFTLYRRERAQSPSTAADFEVNANGGPAMTRVVHLESRTEPPFWYVLDRAIAHRHGVAICGPPPDQVFADVSRRVLLDMMVDSMRWHRQHEKATLYSVLNASRAWRFAAENALGSKLEGAAWARERWSSPWIIDAAVDLRHGQPAPLDVAEVDALLDHVEETLVLSTLAVLETL